MSQKKTCFYYGLHRVFFEPRIIFAKLYSGICVTSPGTGRPCKFNYQGEDKRSLA